jgi:glucose-6-phosphate-specific signal transduction histidine kinase
MSLKLAVTGWLLLAVEGLGVAGLQIYVRTGLTPSGALRHYLGDEATLRQPMSFMEIVGVTHAHGFSLPLVAVALAFAFIASSAREWVKSLVVIALFTGMTLELGLPWLVRYGPAWSVHLFLLTGALLVGGVFVSVAVPLYEMWWLPAKPKITVMRPPQPQEAPRLRRAR